jgi:hypothetical protein
MSDEERAMMGERVAYWRGLLDEVRSGHELVQSWTNGAARACAVAAEPVKSNETIGVGI